jgi:DNA (cytosine-5)-methyltransferase 1
MSLTVGSLFAGIGGFDLGLTRAGFEVTWQVEIDPWCRAVLAQHWPEVTRYADVRDVHGPHVADAATEQSEVCTGDASACARRREQSAGIGAGRGNRGGVSAAGVLRPACLAPVDVICGGFPCQPHSLAGRRAGSDDERDLWPEFARLIRECRPRWVVAENVPGLLSSDAGRFFGAVLADLAACGYNAEWDCLPASAFGAPHRRDRVWIVAYPNQGWQLQPEGCECDERRWIGYRRETVADAKIFTEWTGLRAPEPGGQRRRRFSDGDWWRVEPDVGRVAHGVPARVDRLKGLGNAIVPQIAEWIGRRILEADVTWKATA